MQLPNEFWGAVGAVCFLVVTILNLRKTDRLAAKVNTTDAKVDTVHTEAKENKEAIDNTAAMLELMKQQNGISSDQVKIQSDVLDNQRSNEARQAAERETWRSSVDHMAIAVEAMTTAVTTNNGLAVDIRDAVGKLPEAIAATQKAVVKEVVEHMDGKLDPRDEELKKRLDSIDQNIVNLRELIEAKLQPATPTEPPIPADKPSSPVVEKEPQS